jgi:hypothetical protein
MPMALPRIAGALLALVGATLGAIGLWFAAQLGSHGTASFTAHPAPKSPVLIGPDVLNRVDGPVTITAYGAGSSPVTISAAAPSDAQALLGKSKATLVTGVELGGWKLRTEVRDGGEAPAVASADLWRNTAAGNGSASMRIEQADAPETVVVTAPEGVQRVVATWADSTWFVTAVIVALVGLALLLGGVLLLVRSRRKQPEPVVESEPVLDGGAA